MNLDGKTLLFELSTIYIMVQFFFVVQFSSQFNFDFSLGNKIHHHNLKQR